MSIDFFIRLVGMVTLSVIGGYAGSSLSYYYNVEDHLLYIFTLALVGALAGFILTPYLTTRPIRSLKALIGRLSAEMLTAALVGLVVGLLVAALLSIPLSMLPSPLGDILPFIGVILFTYLGITIFVMRHQDFANVLGGITSRHDGVGAGAVRANRTVLLDTSVIIDGRIADIANTGFLPGTLLIPRFVLNELQYIADSSDGLRRQRGRRGMEVLAELQKAAAVVVRISDIDVQDVREVDDKLVILARQLKCPILTNDYNLNRVAELQGVAILNINELANAVKSVVLPGELMTISVIQEGKEPGQGVSYMDDGTMVVVENGREYMNKEITVLVTKVLQTAAGRMIFARPEG